eukprot:TRINITY_DN90729_c0_g1_i1.p1 TRINITY_DN90729_c0_g1~~TRINITY_DN90729_c0_g1_i1.p1  ORF type:complete len:462 (-),score=99.69 TRINITY_DN90729_c0_g1_i1:142-1527(-)
MEPAYIESKLLDAFDASTRQKLVAEKFDASAALSGKVEAQSTASSEAGADMEEDDHIAASNALEVNQDSYPYDMWGGWPGAAGFYGDFGCWPHPFGFGLGPASMTDMSGMPFAQDVSGFSWPGPCGPAGAGLLPPPPPDAPPINGMSFADGELDVPAPPPGMPVVNTKLMDPPPGLVPPAPTAAPTTRATSSAAKIPPPPSMPPPAAMASLAETDEADASAARHIAEAVAVGALDLDDGDAGPPGLPPPPALVRAQTAPGPQERMSFAAAFAPPTLRRERSEGAPPAAIEVEKKDNVYRVRWNVDAKKLKVKDKVVVSPSFNLSTDCLSAAPAEGLVLPGALGCTFRMVMYPTAVSDRKGGASFRKAKGRGSVHLKCESQLTEAVGSVLSVRFLIRSPCEDDPHQEPPRGPVVHNFFESGFCSLPKNEAEWDFGRATDAESLIFVVLLEISAASLLTEDTT